MIDRKIGKLAQGLFKTTPTLTITGPRQSGKTTLTRAAFPELPYLNLEDLATREFAISDPVAFMSKIQKGAIIDEIQRAPDLLSQVQVIVDDSKKNSLFVLTGSSQFQLLESISQSLAGRTALLQLLPLSVAETDLFGQKRSLDELIFRGFYPRIYDEELDPTRVLGDYFETYVERDLRAFSRIQNLSMFRRFIRLCAGRIGQLLKIESLANDVGVSATTIKHWLSILEASYVIFLLQPYHANIRKRLVKTPKLYFHDVGLASYLLGLEKSDQVFSHPLRGSLFENLIISEVLKHRFNAGKRLNITFYRDARANEVDVLLDIAGKLIPLEIKAGETLNQDYFKGFAALEKTLGPHLGQKFLVYGGTRNDTRSEAIVTNIRDLPVRLAEFEI